MNDFEGFYAAPYIQWAQTPGQEFSFDTLSKILEAVPPGEEHWESIATALLHVRGYATAKFHPSDVDRATLQALLDATARNRGEAHRRLMRVILAGAAAGQTGLTFEDIGASGVVVREGGQLEDVPGDCSTQYHAYLLLLIMRFGDPCCEKTNLLVADALNWLHQADIEDGDPNGRGRGRFQLIGYVCMQECLSLLSKWQISMPERWKNRVASRVDYRPDSGEFPLTWTTPLNRFYLTDGSHLDAPAFARLWLGRPALTPAAKGTCLEGLVLHALPGNNHLLAGVRFGPILGFEAPLPQALPAPKWVAAVRALQALALPCLQSLFGKRPGAKPLPPQRLSTVARAGHWRISRKEVNCVPQLWLTPAHRAPGLQMDTVWCAPGYTLDEEASLILDDVVCERLTWGASSTWRGYRIRLCPSTSLRLVFKQVRPMRNMAIEL